MRNKLYKILAAGFALALAFTFSCSSGDDGNGDNNGDSNLSDLPKQTYLDDGSEYKNSGDITLRIPFYRDCVCGGDSDNDISCTCTDYDGVEHKCSYEEANRYELKPAGKIENGNVSLDLPENIDSKYLRRMKDQFCRKGNECSVSPENLTSFLPRLYVSIFGNSECMLYPNLKKLGDDRGANLIYTSQSGKITGKECRDNEDGVFCDNYDVNFSKGWNVLYRYGVEDNRSYTTTLSKTGGTLEWQIQCSTDG